MKLLAYYFSCALMLIHGSNSQKTDPDHPSFIVDYENDQFLKDGQPFRFISGTLHYYQIPKPLWRDRMEKSRAAGLNMIQTYVPWYKHEPGEGRYDFEGDNDLLAYLRLASELGLLVSFRHGPYIDAEQDMGGLPYWLLKDKTMSLRGLENKKFVEATERWFGVLLPKIRPFLCVNGGPVVMVQVENEYGAWGCDHAYPKSLYDLAVKHLGTDVVYFTADQSNLDSFKCGRVNGTLSTANFGVHTPQEVIDIFAQLRQVMPKGPLVNSEFYPGWYDRWGESHHVLATETIMDTLKSVWSMNASVNFYAIHGGTNWGYQAGSGYVPPFSGVTTSYDFDAPVSECGDVTDKYLALRRTVEQMTGAKVNYSIPSNSTKQSYGPVRMENQGSVLDLIDVLTINETVAKSAYPLTFEDLDHPYGFVLYEHVVESGGGSVLMVSKVRDRAYVMVDGGLVQIIQREKDDSPSDRTKIRSVKMKKGSKIQILIENQGRVAYGPSIVDRKGLLDNVTLDGQILSPWTMYPLNPAILFERPFIKKGKKLSKSQLLKGKKRKNAGDLPSLYYGQFVADHRLADTFFDSSQWAKGQLFVNGRNIGRYWSDRGPQLTLYVPRCFLNATVNNRVVIFELENPKNCTRFPEYFCQATFIDHPKYLKK